MPGKGTPFLLLFGCDCRNQIDSTSPSLDDEGMDGLHNIIADKSKNFRQVQEVRKDLQHRHEQRHLRRVHQNAGIRRPSTGTRVKQGDLVLVKEADSALHNDCVPVKLTRDRWTGPWTITAATTPGLCYRATLQGRRERVRAAASHIKPYHLRPPSQRHNFGGEYAHFAWGLDLGLAAASTLASPIYTMVHHCPIQLPTDPGSRDTAGIISTVPSQDLSQRLNAWTAFQPCSWTYSTLYGSCINRATTGPDPLQSQQAENASQLTEHTLC